MTLNGDIEKRAKELRERADKLACQYEPGDINYDYLTTISDIVTWILNPGDIDSPLEGYEE